MVMIRQPGIDNAGFVASDASPVWYAQGLLLFLASAMTDTEIIADLGICYDWRWKHTMILRMVIISIKDIMALIANILINPFQAGWNLSVPWSYTSLTTRNQFLTSSQWYPGKTASSSCQWHRNRSAQPTQSFRGSTWRLPAGSGDGCRMWFVN